MISLTVEKSPPIF